MSYSPISFASLQGTGSSRQVVTNFVNETGSTLVKGTPVAINSASHIIPISVSTETIATAMIGLTYADIPNGQSGPVIDSGRLENLSTGFSSGDIVYVSASGGLTNIKPNTGANGFVAGDFVLLIGVVVENEYNPSLLDIQLLLSVVGEL